jgi:hypothetical protein
MEYSTTPLLTKLSTGPDSRNYVVLRLVSKSHALEHSSKSPKTDAPSPPEKKAPASLKLSFGSSSKTD